MSDPLDLITSPSQLQSANDGMSNFWYQEVAPSPLQFGDAWFQSEMRFKYNNRATVRSMEAMSYLRMRLKLTKGDGNRLTYDDAVAPSMNPISTLFQKCEFICGGQTVTSVTENLAAVSSLENRIMNSGTQLDKGEDSLYLMSPNFEDRQDLISIQKRPGGKLLSRYRGSQVALIDEAADTLAATAATGTFTYVDAAGGDLDLRNYYKVGDWISFKAPFAADTEGFERRIAQLTTVTQLTLVVGAGAVPFNMAANVAVNGQLDIRKMDQGRDASVIEICWRPPLGIFSFDKATPAGAYELVLQPYALETATKRFFESMGLVGKTSGAGADNVKIDIVSCYFYVAKFNAPSIMSGTFMLDLVETRCQRKTVRSSASETQEDFVVSPTTSALTLAFQDNRESSDTRFSPTQFIVGGPSQKELKLIKYFINYADQQRPQRVPDLTYDSATATDYMVQQYNNTMSQVKTLYESGSSETIDDWRRRGQYYYLNFPRSGEDRATVVNAFYQFSEAIDNMSVLLFSHTRKVVTIQLQDARISKVSVDYV